MNFSLTFTVGIGLDGNGVALTPTEVFAALPQLRAFLCDRFGGFTHSVVQGGWRDPRGVLFVEPAARIEVLATDRTAQQCDAAAADFAALAKRLLRQQCVAYSRVKAHVAFL